MGHTKEGTDTGSHKGGERPQQEAGSERSERLELLVNWSQGPRLMFGKGGPRPKAPTLSNVPWGCVSHPRTGPLRSVVQRSEACRSSETR